jgi:hypothetical protein
MVGVAELKLGLAEIFTARYVGRETRRDTGKDLPRVEKKLRAKHQPSVPQCLGDDRVRFQQFSPIRPMILLLRMNSMSVRMRGRTIVKAKKRRWSVFRLKATPREVFGGSSEAFPLSEME